MTDKDAFVNRAKIAFAPELKDRSLKITENTFDAKHFGNATVSLAGAAFTVVVRRDRGQESAVVVHPKYPKERYPLQLVVRIVTGEEEPFEYWPNWLAMRIETAAGLYRAHRSALEQSISKNWPAVRSKLVSLTAEIESKAESWRRSPEGKKWLADLLRLVDEAVRNPSEEAERAVEKKFYER